MDGSNLSISALKDKVSSKLSAAKTPKASKQSNGKTGEQKKTKSAVKEEKQKEDKKRKDKSVSDKKVSQPKSKRSSTADTPKAAEREANTKGSTKEDRKLVEGINEKADLDLDSVTLGGDENLNSDLSKFMNGLGFPEQSVAEPKEKRKGKKDASKKVETTQKKETQKRVEKEVSRKDKVKEKSQEKSQEKGQETVKTNISKPKPSNHIKFNDDESSQVVVSEMIKNKNKETRESDKITNIQSVNPEKLVIECRIDWYNIETPAVDEPEKLDRFALERLTERAKTLVDSENSAYLTEFTSNNSQKKFLSQILSDGTLNDKISALTLLVQEAPFHNIKAFDTLVSYCEKKNRTASLQAINALKDLFLNGLLPDRKLVSFAKQPLDKNTDTKRLALCYFEDHLKKAYFKFIQVLEFLSHDPILHVRMNVVSHIFDLLKAKPEQEANLLRLGVNKLGDIENKVSAKTSFQILQLEEAHPAMKRIVTNAVTDMVLQKKNDYHSQYYTILTLNQTILSRADVELANSLVKTYFSLFEKILVESDPALKENAEDKVLGKSEMGRKNNRKSFKKGKKGGKSVKAEEKSEEEVVEERSAKMFSALLTGLNRAFPFADLPSEIYSNHLNTLYKITHSTNFNTSVQALVLVQQIITQQDLDSNRFYRTLYESLMDPRLANSSKQGIYLNLLFKSLKRDITNVPRVLAFVKRILQICCHWINVGAITGMFYLLMELSKTHPQILELMEAPDARPENLTTNVPEASEASEAPETPQAVYDPKKRDPAYANAQSSSMWEMSSFVNHYHPTVAIYATSLIDGTPQAKPDLGLYSLAHFLDRFVYKNAKQKSNLKGSSIMQPLGGGHSGSLLVRATNVKSSEVPVNTIDWLSKKAESVKPDERFFYEYFTRNERKIKTKKASETEDGEFDEEKVWDALVKSRPDVEGSDEDDMSDFDADDFAGMSDLSDDDEADDFPAFDDDDDAALSDAAIGSDDDAEASDDAELAAFQDEDDEISEGETGSGDEEVSEPTDGKKRKADVDEKKKKKAKLSSLPTFASADDYAEYLQSDDEF